MQQLEQKEIKEIAIYLGITFIIMATLSFPLLAYIILPLITVGLLFYPITPNEKYRPLHWGERVTLYVLFLLLIPIFAIGKSNADYYGDPENTITFLTNIQIITVCIFLPIITITSTIYIKNFKTITLILPKLSPPKTDTIGKIIAIAEQLHPTHQQELLDYANNILTTKQKQP